MSSSKEFITGLIELYRSKTCLWQTTSPEYTNKNLKNDSYKELVQYSRQYFKEADKSFVQQKLQNLRTAFRKEFKKVEDSKRSGSGSEDIYEPKLWYYKLLLFTAGDIMPCESLDSRKKSIADTELDDDVNDDQEYSQEIENSIHSESELGGDANEFENESSTESLTGTTPSSVNFKTPRTPKQIAAHKRKILRKKEDEFLTTCSQAISKITAGNNIQATQNLDEYDALGIHWAAKMRKLDEYQKILAEDLINQIMKKAYFKELTRATHIEDYHSAATTSSSLNEDYESIVGKTFTQL